MLTYEVISTTYSKLMILIMKFIIQFLKNRVRIRIRPQTEQEKCRFVKNTVTRNVYAQNDI